MSRSPERRFSPPEGGRPAAEPDTVGMTAKGKIARELERMLQTHRCVNECDTLDHCPRCEALRKSLRKKYSVSDELVGAAAEWARDELDRRATEGRHYL